MSKRTVVLGGHVLTMDERLGDLSRGDVVIEDGLIVSVCPEADISPDDVIVDASGCVVIPGFVDCHRHVWQTFLRGVVPNCTLPTYVRDVLGTISPHVTPADGYVGTLLGALECLNAGITTVLDWSHGLRTPEDSDARVSGLIESGIRAYFAPMATNDFKRLRTGQFSGNDGLVRLAAGLTGPGMAPDETVTADWALARELDLLISIHAGARFEGFEGHEADGLARLGLLDSDVHFAHGNQFTDDELTLVADAGANIAMSPYAEMTAGLGPVRPARFVRHGIRPGLSADATAMAPGDMFSQMRTAFAVARAEQLPADSTRPYDPDFQIRDVLEFATIAGARSIGLGDVCGSLTVGKQADIVLVRGDDVNTAPVVDPVATVVLSADTSNVDTVIIAGKVVKCRGALVDVDLAGVVLDAAEARDRVLRASNWPVTS